MGRGRSDKLDMGSFPSLIFQLENEPIYKNDAAQGLGNNSRLYYKCVSFEHSLDIWLEAATDINIADDDCGACVNKTGDSSVVGEQSHQETILQS